MPTVPGDEQMAAQQAAWLQQLLQMGQQGTQVNTSNPLGSQTWSTDANGNRTLTQAYSPGVTQDFTNQLANRNTQSGILGAGASGLSTALAGGPFNTANINAPGISYGNDPGSIMTGYDRSGFSAIPGADDFQGNQQQVQDALYARSTADLDPQFAQAQSQLDTKLRNQGFQAGDEGDDAAQGNFDRSKNNAYASARNDAIAGGASTANTLLAQALAIRNQQGQEGQQDLQNYDTAQAQNFGQRTANSTLNNAGQNQAVTQAALNYTLPASIYQMASGAAPTGSMIPNFGTGTTSLAQPNSPSFLDFTTLGANNQQTNANRNTSIASSVVGGLANSGLPSWLISALNSPGAPDLSTIAPIAGGAMTDMIDMPDWSSFMGF